MLVILQLRHNSERTNTNFEQSDNCRQNNHQKQNAESVFLTTILNLTNKFAYFNQDQIF